MEKLSIKLFADGADKKSILELSAKDWVSGFTTNPTLMRKAGVQDYTSFALEVLAEVKNKPISFEVFSDDFEEMKLQALTISSWADNVYVKIPITNTKGESAVPLIRELSHTNVKINVTAIFTLSQIYNTVTALKGGAPSVVSVFAGRIADTGIDPQPIMSTAVGMAAGYDSNIEVLWASPRELLNIKQAESVGCHIITVPPDILSKLGNLDKDLNQFSLETVQMFYKDAKAAGFKI